jgi:nucleotide-binding universal stress UspA family protein
VESKEAPKPNERTKILCPVDFSEPSNAALAYATDLARVIGADLHLVHVIPLLAYALRAQEAVDDPQFAVHVREEAMRRLEVLKAERVSKGLQVTVSAIEGAPHEGIARAVDETGASMIVIGTHGHTGFSRLLLGSTAEKVVRTSHVPVLSVRPLAAAESA